MLFEGMEPRGRAGALVVTAAAACVLGFAPTALASTSGAEAQSTARPADLGLALALIVVASITTWLRSGAPVPRIPRAQAKRVPARSPASGRGRPVRGAVAVPPSGGRQVVGYAVGRSDRDFARQRQAMGRICHERGWKLSALVKERAGGRRKPGLANVLKEVRSEAAGQLVVGRLQSLARCLGAGTPALAEALQAPRTKNPNGDARTSGVR